MWETRSYHMYKRVFSHMQIRHANAHCTAPHVLPTPEHYSSLRAQLKKKSLKLQKTLFQHILPYTKATQALESPFEPPQTTATGVTQTPDQVHWWCGQRRQRGCNLSIGMAKHQGAPQWSPCTAQQPGQPPTFPPHSQVQTKRKKTLKIKKL